MTPLQGVRVLALEQAVAGPLCTRHLADLGADVIKIERPGGGDFARTYDRTVHGLSSYFVWLNRGKRSLSLDLKHPSATGILDRLIERSDVVVQNLGPGAIDRLGYPPAALRERFPRLVVCGISGYGSSGPYVKRKAFDLLLQGETGVIATTGDGESMAKLGISVGDIGAGVYGAMGVLAALFERQTTGQGKIVETSLFDALAEFMGYPAYYTLYGGTPPARAGVRHATVVPYGAYRCGDGQQVLFAVQTDQHWTAFCTIVAERPEWLDDSRFDSPTNRRIHRDILEPAIEAAFESLDRAEVNRRLEVADIPYGDLNEIAQFLDHPQLTERNRWREVQSPGGPVRSILPPWTMEGTDLVMGDIPGPGEDTDVVLAELGYTQTDIDGLRADRAI
ncbi:MAG: CoA transferase [Thermomicrobiales bacterium]|jgi:formyl-CoA transferase|nr:CoA transferase [Thermomicrobiales bacterium]